MKTLRWVIMIPLAIIAMMLGSLFSGIIFSIFGNQIAVDSSSAFFGCFALVFIAGFIAPVKRSNTALIFACVVFLLALVSLVASFATSIEGFADRSTIQKILIPVSQILGALYAAFLLPPLITPGTLLEQIWKEINTLGIVVILFGILISIGGLVARIFVTTWAGATIGLGVIILGISTWLFPFAHVFLCMRKLTATMTKTDHKSKN
ncbi:MAG: hypothetical protein PHO00_07590 [bacterium]|nr:hypothetical protein [bacterium]